MTSSPRRDPWLATVVHVVGSRQGRPNLPAHGECPFCVGGLEAAEPYDVRSFPNRWPPMPGERCEVILYSPDHDGSFTTLSDASLALLADLWASRTAVLGARDDVASVLVFENHGREVGATIDHPHGQLYAFDHVPERTRRRLEAGWRPDPSPERVVDESDGWVTYVPEAPVFPVSLEIAPLERRGDLPSLSPAERLVFARALRAARRRIERLFPDPAPTMTWINQGPFDGSHRDAWLHVEIVSPWRAHGVPRYIAAAEVATGEFFNPVVPEDLAARLRAVDPA